MSCEPERELQITGGPGGTAARLEDLDRCAARLRSAADSMGQVWSALARVQVQLDEWSRSPVAPGPGVVDAVSMARRAHAAVEAARSSPSGPLALANELRATGDDVARTRGRYSESESLATRLWRRMSSAPTPGFWLATPFFDLGSITDSVTLWDVRQWVSGDGFPADKLERAVNRLSNRMSSGPFPFLWRDDPVPWLARRFATIDRPGTEVRALPVIGSRREGPPPRDVASITTALMNLSREPGSADIEISETRDTNGNLSWVVLIPGTGSWGLAGSDPFDLGSNINLVAGMPSDSSDGVLKAMEAAGIGKDDPVVLAGYSQGGLVANQVANTGGYAVAALLTIGSPVGSTVNPVKVQALSLEHPSDAVPAADGRPNADTPHHTTVRAVPREGVRRRPDKSHTLVEYEELARAVDASDHPSTQAWRTRVDEAVGGAETVTTRTFRVQRCETAR